MPAPKRPTHINSVLPLMDLAAEANKLRTTATKQPLTEDQRKFFLALSVKTLREMGFTDEQIIAEIEPTPKVAIDKPSSYVLMPATPATNGPEPVRVPSEKTGFFGGKKP